MTWLRRLIAWLTGPRPPAPPAPPAPAPPPDPTPGPPPDDDLVAALNAARAQHGRPALAADARLAGVAAGWAAGMAARGRLAHGDFGGRIAAAFPARPGGETIAEGASTAAAVVALWLASPPHRAILVGDFTLVGWGRAAAADGTTYWCADFVR